MLQLLVTSIRRLAKLVVQVFSSPVLDGRSLTATLLLILAIPLALLWLVFHWVTWLLDEIFFRGYRRVEIVDPIFVLGPPRSGTTHLHHVLSLDEATTTFHTWECLFGLSVTGRKLCLSLAALDRLLGRPVGRSAGWLGQRLFGSMDDVHPVSLTAPEEDFLCLLPLLACFLIIVPFPRASWLWRMARFDNLVAPDERRAILAYYRACVQKHLYVFGPDKRFLSKNASFSGMAQSLLEEFPGARILACTRDPLATVPSQLSALRPALAGSGFAGVSEELRDRLVDLLRFYYLHLSDTAAEHPDRLAFVANHELRDELAACVSRALAAVGLAPSPTFLAQLETVGAASRGFRSSHAYTLDEFGLDADLLRSLFSSVYSRYSFEQPGNG
ncbi:MAG: sulfotransferase [Gammaproteobacteria bacterium]|nr:sulfotransferase [Gammaproteobacteria bacterium]